MKYETTQTLMDNARHAGKQEDVDKINRDLADLEDEATYVDPTYAQVDKKHLEEKTRKMWNDIKEFFK